MNREYTRRLGLRKFATMTDRQITVALKKAIKFKIISEIPNSNDDQLELLRSIAVVTNGGYSFLKSK